MNIKRKWEWIADKCEELGYINALKIALVIDATLDRLYGQKTTRLWDEDYDALDEKQVVDMYDLMDIAGNVSYCVACEATPHSHCPRCLFGKEARICSSRHSLYDKFCIALEMSSTQLKSEERQIKQKGG